MTLSTQIFTQNTHLESVMLVFEHMLRWIFTSRRAWMGAKIEGIIVHPKNERFIPFVDRIYQKTKNEAFLRPLILSCTCKVRETITDD